MIIRVEKSKDHQAVYALNRAAFGGEDEAKLVNNLRSDPSYISLVAESNGAVIGHIAFSAVTLNDEPTSYVGLAPMSVIPDVQRRGIGGSLIEAGIEACSATGAEAVFVLGHPSYYPKFGFIPAKPRGFTCIYPDSEEAFMILEIVPGSLNDKNGMIKYASAFDLL